MADDLVAFLRARLDEDERVAKAAAEEGARWSIAESGAMSSAGVWADDAPDPSVPVVYDEGYPSIRQATHIARHDPARVLAEVQAKRHVIDEHELIGSDLYNDGIRWCQTCAPRTTGPCTTLRLLALPYAGHESYRAEWAPSLSR